MTDCSAQTYNGRCQYRAKAVVDGEPLCGQHARAAARKAAEAAEKAAFWEKLFTPSPAFPFAGDPEWQALQRIIVEPPGATAQERTAAVLEAIPRRYAIEVRYELERER